ncbi:MAG: TIGR00725 family protein, partial [Nitrospinota bacterium]
IAIRGAILVCGGLGGVMEAAARGAREGGGLTVGILPGCEATEANPYIDIPIVTGMSHARNLLIVRTAEVVIALPGEYGTLSEIALALKIGRPVVGLHTWSLDQAILQVSTPQEAVEKAFALLDSAAKRRF